MSESKISNPSTGPELYEKAKRLIPGGTQLLSKRPEMFLPGGWPAYYQRAKGCEIWDLDDRRLIDMSIMGIGACLLGYADDDVNAAVKARIDAGSMTTLNNPEEVALAERLCEIHPWAQMARFARTGGEALAVAIRIARAYSGRSVVAFSGYHGWSDWYLAANLGDDAALDGHLLPGLEPAGVPRGLAKTARSFRYNRLDELERIVAEVDRELSVIIIESRRADPPAAGFFEGVRRIADDTGAVMIFDEVTAGWRYTLGGAHLLYGVEPDMAVFAKALSNGFPMSAVIGQADVMQATQTSFISSTYWTEGIGPTAALATIDKYRQLNLSDHLDRIGRRVLDGWRAAAEATGIRIEIADNAPLAHFAFDYGDLNLPLRTLLTQEMLDRGYLARDGVYVSLAHTETIVDDYLAAIREVFAVLVNGVDAGDVQKRLRGDVAHSGFQRLT
jgi:glutamate-1-semialdehyde aminotransferase